MKNAIRNAGRFAAALLFACLTSAALAGAMMDYLENALINHVFRGTAYTAPATIYVGLSSTSCSDSSPGTEITGGSYARVGIASGAGTWAATNGTNGTTSNVSTVTFATPSAGWGTVTSVVLYDASSGGNGLTCSALTVPKTINNGDDVKFPPGAITFQIDN